MDFSTINLAEHQDVARQIIVEAIRQAIANRRDFQVLRNRIIKRHQASIFHNLYFVKAYEDLVKEGKIIPNEMLLSLIQKRRVRTMSGVAPVTVITKPYPCPGKCTYCPTDVRMPKSYLPSQPAAQRGFRQRFDPYSQVYVRLKALELEGHEVSKVELRILGGTWSSYPKQYQTWFVKRCLQAMNDYPFIANPKSEILNSKEALKNTFFRVNGDKLAQHFVEPAAADSTKCLRSASPEKGDAQLHKNLSQIFISLPFASHLASQAAPLRYTSLASAKNSQKDVFQSFSKQYQNQNSIAKIVRKKVVSRYGIEYLNKVDIRSLSKKPVSLIQMMCENETADVRCIGINIETRPDWISVEEIRQLRKLGVTKVELGVQTLDDHVQALTRRGHGTAETIRATRLLKDAGFKVGYHMMPNLPGSTVEEDKRMIRELFTNTDYQPDYLKIYPCVVIPGTSLAVQYRRGDYKPYDDATLEEVLLDNLRSVPEWCRIDRVARDIPADKIEAGSRVSNIRQLLERKLEACSAPCRDIRAREIGGLPFQREDVKLVRREYGYEKSQIPNLKSQVLSPKREREIFLSFEDQRQDKLIALLRLRFPGETFLPELKGAALIRDLHVYGKQVPVGERSADEKQHVGWGTMLMKEAERIARDAGFKKIAVIAGIGTREYYRKLGYWLGGTYMIKSW